VLRHFDAKRRRPLVFSDAFINAVEGDLAAMSETIGRRNGGPGRLLPRLRPEDRALIDRRYVPGPTRGRFAAAVGRPLSTVYRMLARNSSRVVGVH